MSSTGLFANRKEHPKNLNQVQFGMFMKQAFHDTTKTKKEIQILPISSKTYDHDLLHLPSLEFLSQ